MLRTVQHALKAPQAADAALDICRTAISRLLRPEGIRQQWAAQADKILHTVRELLFCLLRTADQVRRQHGNLYLCLDRLSQIFSPAALKLRRFQPVVHCLICAAGNIQCIYPEFLQPFGDLQALLQGIAVFRLAELAVKFIHRQAHDQWKICAALFANLANDVGDKAHPVLKGSPVLIGAPVGIGAQELLNQIAVCAVQLHAVSARLLHTEGGLRKFILNVDDLLDGKGARFLALQTARDSTGRRNRREQMGLFHQVTLLSNLKEQAPIAVKHLAGQAAHAPGGGQNR